MANLDNTPDYIKLLVEANKHLEISLEEFFADHTNEDHIHNATLENLFLYFSLDTHLAKGRVVFYKGTIFIIDNRKYKFFIFDNPLFLTMFSTSIIPDEFKKKFIFYSSVYQHYAATQGTNSVEKGKERFVLSKLKEAVYNLEEVFDEQTYFEKYKDRKQSDIKKKIYNRIRYPFNFLEKNKDKFRVEDITEDHLESMEALHKEWADYKLADPNTFKMMFSSARYNRTIRLMFNHDFMHRDHFFCKAFYWEDKLIAIRQCLVLGEYSYDIGFFSSFWSVPSNLILYINSWCLRELKNSGVKYHNCGMVLDKNLERSKSHFPNSPKITYKYNLK